MERLIKFKWRGSRKATVDNFQEALTDAITVSFPKADKQTIYVTVAMYTPEYCGGHHGGGLTEAVVSDHKVHTGERYQWPGGNEWMGGCKELVLFWREFRKDKKITADKFIKEVCILFGNEILEKQNQNVAKWQWLHPDIN